MRLLCMRFIAAALAAAMLFVVADPTLAQSADPKAAEKLLGGPAANPECLWLGRRVVGLLWKDDLDTAFRHLDLYDRFGCPTGHIQVTFLCLVRQGTFDPKATDTLNSRIHACWVNPSYEAKGTAAAPGVTTAR